MSNHARLPLVGIIETPRAGAFRNDSPYARRPRRVNTRATAAGKTWRAVPLPSSAPRGTALPHPCHAALAEQTFEPIPA